MTRLLLALALFTAFPRPAAGQPPAGANGPDRLLGRLEQVVRAGDPAGYDQLLGVSADRQRAARFAAQVIGPGASRVAIRERDRVELPGTLPGDGYQLLVEVIVEAGARARLVTWRLDVRRRGGSVPGAPDEWGIVDQLPLTSLQGLHRLSLNPNRQYAAHNLAIVAEDLQVTLESGTVFVAETEAGITGLVLLGRGEMTFTPSPAVERGQVRLLTGSDSLASPFEVAVIRLPPAAVDAHLDRKALSERAVDPREFRRAEEVFRQETAKSFVLDLGDLSSESWSLLPSLGDFLAEVRTRRYDVLTYARSTGEVEDISLFDRKNRHNIALYSSREHLERFTRFFDEDEQAEFAVSHYDLDVSFNPARRSIEGRARLAIRTRAEQGTSTLTIRLADSLAVRSVVSNEFGRLLFVRVRNQDAIVVNLPATLLRGVPLTLTIDYGGVLLPQPIDREALWPQRMIIDDSTEMPMEESYLYSNRSYWYPQSPTLGYATASVAITVPSTFGCVASGDPLSVTPAADDRSTAAPRRYVFAATQPVRYLTFLVTPLVEARNDTIRLAGAAGSAKLSRRSGVFYDEVTLLTKTNPRLRGRGRDLARTAQDIIRFYSSLVGDYPYPTLTLAVVERPLPAGHSPPYLAVVAQPTPGSRLTFRDDPASFPEFPEFFVAHELAHQWWGQAVGWKNYHEQWLSEGFAQYFAALYAERVRGPVVFDSMMRRMRRWAREESDQGPVYLGYRVGHVKGDSRLFRAVVYNKGAAVLHTLRLLLGDRVFFAGIRRFYERWRFDKAGTDDLRQALEAEARIPLTRFFEQWIYGQTLPQVAFKWRVEQKGAIQEAVLRFEQLGEPFDVPVRVTLDYLGRAPMELPVTLDQPLTEIRVPLPWPLRRAEVNRDDTLAVLR